MTKTTLAALFLAATTLPAMAQDTATTNPDADGDGQVSLVELQALLPEVTPEAFIDADTDADGLLSMDELSAAQEAGTLPMIEG